VVIYIIFQTNFYVLVGAAWPSEDTKRGEGRRTGMGCWHRKTKQIRGVGAAVFKGWFWSQGKWRCQIC